MRTFGWDLPPGVTNRMIDEHFGEECCDECNGDNLSDCCGASYDDDIGICMDCKEHCESAGCGDEDCACHWDDEEWAAQKADMRD